MSLESLIETIKTEKPLKAAQAIQELAKLSDDRVPEILIEILHKGNILTQQAAAEVLATFNTDSVTAALCDALCKVPELICIHIIKSLEQMKRTDTIPCLIAALQNAEAESLKYTIIEALGNMDAVDARDAIEPYMTHPNHHVRKRAIAAYNKINQLAQS